jgi:hypothetical protein
MKISMKYSILKIQTSLIWWRLHTNQESIVESRNKNILASRYSISIEYLEKSCLSIDLKKKAKLALKKNMARKLILLILTFNFSSFNFIYSNINFRFFDLLLAFSFKNRFKKLFKV